MLTGYTNRLKHNILIAEDDVFTAKVYKTYLQKSHIDVNIVHNGAEVLEFLKWKKPRLMVMDLMMPVMNGFDTLEAIHAKKLFDPQKIIVLTSLSQSDDVDYIKTFGIREYLIKQDLPIQTIYQVVSKYL